MRFQVPQFIEVEDKIFGPLTLKQFIYLAAGGAGSFLLFNYLPLFLALLLIVPLAGFCIALAFYKINNKPFLFAVESAFKYVIGSKLYLWKKVPKPITHSAKGAEENNTSVYIPRLSDSKLKDLTWSLDIDQTISAGKDTAKAVGVGRNLSEMK